MGFTVAVTVHIKVGQEVESKIRARGEYTLQMVQDPTSDVPQPPKVSPTTSWGKGKSLQGKPNHRAGKPRHKLEVSKIKSCGHF